MMVDAEDDHAAAGARLVELQKPSSGSCGFHLSRSKWDPYPWVTRVDPGSPADVAGMLPGDCVLEVNGEDVVGKRISEVAERVRSGQVSLLLWNSGMDPHCSPESLCCGPMPLNLQRLSACMSSILSVLECPVCLDTIPPPAHQCDNGHLVCLRCRAKSERCPVCRIRLSIRGRSLLADQVYNSITDAFELREESEQTRKAKIQAIFKAKKPIPDIKITHHANKLLARLTGKSTSVDNLTNPSPKTIPVRVLEDEFGTNLKTKSLSASEINRSSLTPYRGNSFNHLNGDRSRRFLHLKKEPDSSPASYHGSFEALDRKGPSRHISTTSLAEEVFYQCPYDLNCSVASKGSEIIRHFQDVHKGPLVQYFQPKLRLSFANLRLEKDPCYLIHAEDVIFFLRIVDVFHKQNKEGLLLWTWMLSDPETCSNFHFRTKLLNSRDELLLSVVSTVHSLEKVSGEAIVASRKGIFLNRLVMQALDSSEEIFLDIDIVKTDLEQTV